MFIKSRAFRGRNLRVLCVKKEAGFTLMETMISLAISMVAVSAMVALMGNSLGATTRIIQMSQLTDQLRNTMSLLTRDVRRANYSAKAAYCYANSDCGLDGAANQFADIDVGDGSCFIFGLDRNFDGDATTDDAGGFRRVENGGVGLVEMWVGNNSPDCAAMDNEDWVAITDPDLVDVTTFIIDDGESFTGSITGEAGTTINSRTRNIHVQVEGRLVLDNRITRRVEDQIKVRNDFITQS